MSQADQHGINKDAKIYIAGHAGMVGSAILRKFAAEGHKNIVTRELDELDLIRQDATERFFAEVRPEYVIIAAARVGGIMANNTYRAEFIYQNLMIEANLIEAAHQHGVKKLIFLGSSCIYPKLAPQPLREECLLSGYLEYTNEPYAIAKIAGIKLCESYYRQYRDNFISVMPTNLYGPNDNYNLETSHVLPALIRKFHLARLLAEGEWDAIRADFLRYGNGRLRSGGREIVISRQSPEADVLAVLGAFGIQGTDPAGVTSSIVNISTQGTDPSRPATGLGATTGLAGAAGSPNAAAPSTNAGSPIAAHPSGPSDPSSVTVTVWGTGSPLREFLYVDDVADAIYYIAERINAPDLYENGISQINIGMGKDLTIRDLALMVAQVVGFKGAIAFDVSKPDGTPRKLMDVSRLHGLGWHHKVELGRGIGKAYEWYVKAVQ